MRSTPTAAHLVLLVLGLALLGIPVAPSHGAAAQEGGGVRIIVETPKGGAVVRNRTDVAALAGVASAEGAGPAHFELMLVIDVSGSTRYPSGNDVDGDGVVGETQPGLLQALPDTINTDPGDSVLAAEIQAAKSLLGGLDPDRVRVGVVSFAGEIDPSTGRRRSPDQVDALLEQALTNEYDRVRQALDAVLLRGSRGGTNMEAGIKLAVRELAGLSGAVSRPRARAKKAILLLTDGKPSLPFGRGNVEDPEDDEAPDTSATARREY